MHYSIYGKVFNNMNLPDSALIYYEKALQIREKYYQTENKELADSYYFLNKIYFSFYDFEKAMYYNEKAYNIAQKLFPEDDFFNVSILNDKGLIELYSMNHREAERIFEKTLYLTQKNMEKKVLKIFIHFLIWVWYIKIWVIMTKQLKFKKKFYDYL